MRRRRRWTTACSSSSRRTLPYLLSFSRGRIGLLRITYCKRGQVHHEYAELRPLGILYDRRIFQHVQSYVNYFKSHIKEIVGLWRRSHP